LFTLSDIHKAKNFFIKFKNRDFLAYQEQSIEFIINSTKKFVILESPPGTGKSLIGMIAGHLSKNMVYLVQNKALQEQIIGDHPEARLLKGRSNYPCGANPERRADNCPKSKCIPNCEYLLQKQIVKTHPLRILNYSYFITESNFIGGFSGIPFAVLDEADLLSDILPNFISLIITQKDIQQLGLSPPRYRTTSSVHSIEEWRKWAENALKCVKIDYKEIELKIRLLNIRVQTKYHEVLTNNLKRLETLQYKLNLFIIHVDESWIYEVKSSKYGENWSFSPKWLTPELSNEYFFKHFPGKIVMMSAIFPPMNVFAHMLGISLEDIDYLRLPSTFPRENRPVYLRPAGDLTYEKFKIEAPKISQYVIEIMNKYSNKKGLVHCTSYKLRDYFIKYIKTNGNNIIDRIITHNSDNRALQLLLFKQSKKPLVMFSPSFERGISLDDELARFIIVAKCPYENLQDKIVKARLYGSGSVGRLWYQSAAVLTLIQSMYRGNRSPTDYCDIWLIDEQIKKLIFNNLNLFPKYIRDSIQ